MFNFIKSKLSKIYTSFSSKLATIFGRNTLDEATLKELEILLLSADTGVQTTRSILSELKNNPPQEGQTLREAIKPILLNTLTDTPAYAHQDSRVFVLVGINGSGKTTFAGKLAHHYAQQGKKVLMCAADTFRAAAPEQLTQWAQRCGADIVLGKSDQDPASVVFAGCERFKHENYDILIIDTAGRLQTKTNLMNELAKVKRVINKQLANEPISTLLTIDSMLGQNSFEQAKLFKESTDVNGIVLTKMDGTGKGGIVFAITQQLHIPIAYITFGEALDQCKLFDAHEYVENLVSQ